MKWNKFVHKNISRKNWSGMVSGRVNFAQKYIYLKKLADMECGRELDINIRLQFIQVLWK